MNSTKRAVILAGGFGTRISHLLPNIPKPMASVAGRPFVDWIILYLLKWGVGEIVLSAGHLSEVISKHVDDLNLKEAQARCIVETSSMGTAGGFLHAVSHSKSTGAPWLICNGDSLALTPLKPLYEMLEDPKVDGCLIGLRTPDSSRFGSLVVNDEDCLTGFSEKGQGTGLINAGVYLIHERLLKKFPDKRPLSFETEVFPRFLEEGVKIRVHSVSCPFLDIGTEESFYQAEEFIKSNMEQFETEGKK